MKNRKIIRRIAPRQIFATLLVTSVLIVNNSRAQIISNGIDVGATVLNLRLVPSGGTGTLLINPGGVLRNNGNVRNETRGLTFGPAGNYFVTNSGVITNSGTTDSHQGIDVSVSPTSTYSIVNAADGVIALNPANIYEAIRSFGGTGSLTNYGLIQALGSAESVTSRDSRFTIHNEGTIDGGIGFWGGSFPGGTSLTVNQVAGVIKTSQVNPFLGRSFYTFASNTVVNMSGGEWFGNLLFEGGKSSVNLSGGEMNGDFLYRLNASTNDVTVTGGSLSGNLSFGGSTGTITFNRPDNYTYSKVISGNGVLVQAGAGTTTLSGANTYTRGTTISNGMLYINAANALGAGAVLITNTGTLGFGDSFTLANAIITGADSASLFVDKLTTVALSGSISGSGGINKTGSGVLVLSNASTYAGTTTISDGTLSLGGTTGSLGAGAVTNNAILSIDRSNGMTLSNAMSGTGFLVKNGATTLTVTGDLTHTGGTEINAGTVSVGDGGSTGTLGNGGSIINKGSLVFDRSDGGLVVSGNISGTGTVLQAGAGTTTLSGTNTTYSGATTITNGVLRAGSNGALSPNSVYTLDGGALDPGAATNSIKFLEILSGTTIQTNGSLTVTLPDAETIRLARDTGSTATYNLEGGILRSERFANLQVGYRGIGVFNQNGGTNSIGGYFVLGRFTVVEGGVTNVGFGTYNLNGGEALQTSTDRISIIGEDGKGIMNVNGGVYSNAGRILIAATARSVGELNINDGGVVITPRVDFGAGNGLVNFNRSDSYTFVAPIAGNGRVEKNGTGTVTFTNNNSYTRGTTVNAGELRVLGLANDASNTITVNNGGTFVFTRENTFGNHSANILTPIVINSGGLVKNSGNLFNAVGPLTLNGGTLESTGVVNGISFALKGGVTVNSNSTLKGAGFALGSAAVNSAIFDIAANAQLLVDGTLVDGAAPAWPAKQASSLVKSGDGTMTLVGANTYSGMTTINGGTLQVGTNGTTGTLGTGDVENNGLLVLNRSDALTVDNNISGTGSLTKQGDGTTTLTGENSYRGSTTIESGTLVLNGTHTNGLAYTVKTNAVLTGTGSTTSSVIVEGGGVITPGSAAGDVLTVGGLELNTGGTLNVFLNGASTSLLDVNGNVTLGGGVNFITGADSLTASLYTFVTYTGTRANDFAFTSTNGVAGLPSGYGLFYDDDDKLIFLRDTNVPVNIGVDYIEGNEVITGGELPFDVVIVNAGGSDIAVTATNGTNTTGGISNTTVLTNESVTLTGLKWNGTATNTNTGEFTVTYGSTTITNSVQVVVYDHAQGSLTTGNITNLNAIVGYTNPLSSTVTVSNSSGFRVDLATASSSTNANLAFEEAAGIGAGSSGNLTVNLTNQGVGAFTNDVTVTFGDDSALRGATNNVGTTNFTVSGTIFDHALGSASTNAIVFAPVHRGYTAPLTNTTLAVSNSDTSLRVDLGVANDNTDAFILIDPVGGIAQGASTNLAVVLDTGRDTGKFTNNVTLTFSDDSDLAGASTNVGTASIVISGYVYSGEGIWTNSGSGEWTNFDSWDVPGGTPGLDGVLSVNDTATFGAAGSGVVVLNTNASLLAVTFSNSASSYTVQGTGTLTFAESGGTAPSLTTAAGTHTISNAIDVVGDLQLQTTGELLLAGNVSGGSLQHVGAGTTTLAGSNSFAGGLGISNGQVILSNTAATGTGAISLLAREEERVAVPQLVLGNGSMTISNAINLPTDALDPADPNRHLLMAAIEMTGGTNQLTGVITGDGSLEVTGPGTMVVTGTGNTYQGATRVSDGATLEVAAIDGTLGTGDVFYAYLDIVDATFRYTGGTTNTGRELYMNEGSLSTIEVTDANANLTIDPTSPGELNVDFVKAGAGTLTFGAGAVYEGEANITVAGGTFVTEAENTYTGDTTISNGATFKLGGAGQLGSGDYGGNILNAGSVVFDTTADQTVSGVISGAGSLTQSGAGTLTVTAANTYTGTTIIGTGSALVVSGDGRLGSAEVTNEGSLVFDTFTLAEQTLANTVSGSGTLTKTGDGLLTVSGSNTYSGKTTVEAGTLLTTSTTALGTGAVDLLGGTLKLESQLDIGALFWDGAATIAIANPAAGHFVNLGANSLTLTNGTNNFDLTGFTLTTTPVALMSSANMSSFSTDLFGALGVSNYTLLVSNSTLYIALLSPPPPSDLIARPGGTVINPGTEAYPSVIYEPNGILNVMPGANLTVTNPVIMSNNSTTIVNGGFTSPGGFTVQGGSVLTGAGTLIGNVINSGLLNPGNPTGPIKIQGNFTQTPSGTTGLQVAGPNTFSQLFITGTATLAGTLQVTPINGYALQFGDKYQFLNASGGISGAYDNIAMPAGYRGRFLTSENNTKGSLLVAPQSYTQVALTPNQMNVAKALDAFIPAKSGDRLTVSIALDELRASEYPAAFEAIMPSQYASLPNMAFNQANALNSGMFQRLWVIRVNGKGFTSNLGPAPMQAEMGGVDDMDAFAIRPSKDTKWGTFVDGNGIFADGGDVANLQNYRSQSGGVSAGASYKWTDTFATGVYVGYQGLQAQYDNGQTIDNAVRFGIFGTYEIGGLYFNALAGGAYHDYSVERDIEFGSIDRTARGRPGAGEFDLAIGTGYDFKAGDFTFGPFTTMQYTYLGVQGFTETGADSLNLDVDPYDSSSLLYTLGAQIGYNWKVSPSVLVTPTIFAGWQHEFLQNGYQINSSFATGGPASPFSYNTGTPARDNFYGGVGVTVGLGERWQATAIYSAFVGGNNQSSQNVYLGLGLNF